MKFEQNHKYNTIAIYSFLSAISIISFYMFIQNFSTVKGYFYMTLGILSPFIYGFAFAFILSPVLKFIETKIVNKYLGKKMKPKTKRSISILITYIIAFIVLSIFFWVVIPQVIISITGIMGKMSGYVFEIEKTINLVFSKIPADEIPVEITDGITKGITDFINSMYALMARAVPVLLSFTVRFSTGVLNFILGIIISIYIFTSKEIFFAQSKKVLNAFFKPSFVSKMIDLAHESDEIFSGFITGKILDSFIIGIICFVSLTAIKMPNTLLVSLIVGITNVIPYFGPFIGAIPCFVIIFIDSPTKALIFAIFILILQQFDGNILGPKILGESTGLSAFWVVFSILVFSGFMGMVGMFIGVPTFAVIYSAFKKYVNYKLTIKDLPIDTQHYASNEHGLL